MRESGPLGKSVLGVAFGLGAVVRGDVHPDPVWFKVQVPAVTGTPPGLGIAGEGLRSELRRIINVKIKPKD